MNALELAERALASVDGRGALARVVRERSLMLRFARQRGQPSRPPSTTSTVEVAVIRRRPRRPGDHESHRLGRTRGLRRGGPRKRPRWPRQRGRATIPICSSHRAETAVLEGAFDPATALLDPAPGGQALAAAFEVARRSRARGAWDVDGRRARARGDRRRPANRTERATDAFMKVIASLLKAAAAAMRRVPHRLWPSSTGVRWPSAPRRRPLLDGEPVELAPGEYSVVMEPHAVGELLDLFGGERAQRPGPRRGAQRTRRGSSAAGWPPRPSTSPTRRATGLACRAPSTPRARPRRPSR